MRRRLFLAVLVTSLVLLAVTTVQAQITTCLLNLDGVTVGTVQVKSGDCVITNSTVNRNIEVSGGVATISNTTVKGSILSTGGAVRLLGGVEVSGNVRITGTPADVGSGFRNNNTIRGSVEFRDNAGYFTTRAGTIIGGNMRFERNREGYISIVGNKVSGNLECSDNNSPPTGFDNDIRGKRTGQCGERLKGKQESYLRVNE